jgi:hypothetical protein
MYDIHVVCNVKSSTTMLCRQEHTMLCWHK